MYLRIDMLRISAILTDTDRIRIVISLYERIRILCHGYSTDMHYAFILFYFFKFYSMYIVYIRHRYKLQVIEYRVIAGTKYCPPGDARNTNSRGTYNCSGGDIPCPPW